MKTADFKKIKKLESLLILASAVFILIFAGVNHANAQPKKLIKKAEDIAIKAGYKKIAIISGVGVREYYKKRGYELRGTYMCKDLG